MFQALHHEYLVPHDATYRIDGAATAPDKEQRGKKRNRKRLEDQIDELRDLQRRLYAQDQYAVLLIFQAMDAAGKDGTIRAVMSGINPAGCQVFSFKRPSAEELDHDFLWRTACRLPERGRIGIFNRSYYEELLVVRVHPKILDGQRIPNLDREAVWEQRFESIRDHELHLARNGTVILKFWLNVSREEQRSRFIARLENPEKHWKFSAGDLAEAARWDDYMNAYEEALNATSRPWAPWYAIPADDKPYMRWCVANILARTLESLDLRYPSVDPVDAAELQTIRRRLQDEAQR